MPVPMVRHQTPVDAIMFIVFLIVCPRHRFANFLLDAKPTIVVRLRTIIWARHPQQAGRRCRSRTVADLCDAAPDANPQPHSPAPRRPTPRDAFFLSWRSCALHPCRAFPPPRVFRSSGLGWEPAGPGPRGGRRAGQRVAPIATTLHLAATPTTARPGRDHNFSQVLSPGRGGAGSEQTASAPPHPISSIRPLPRSRPDMPRVSPLIIPSLFPSAASGCLWLPPTATLQSKLGSLIAPRNAASLLSSGGLCKCVHHFYGALVLLPRAAARAQQG